MTLGKFVSTVVASATGTLARYQKKAANALALIKDLREQMARNTGHLSTHLESLGFVREVKNGRKGNKYTKDGVVILLYKREQLKHYYENVFPLIKEDCCIANNKEFNSPTTYIALIKGDKHYFFSPDFHEPRPLQVPRSQMQEHLKKEVEKIEEEKRSLSK